MPKRGTQTRKRGAKSKDSSDGGRSGARASSRSQLARADAPAALNPKQRRILEQRLMMLAPSAPMAHERERAHQLLRRAPAMPPARVKPAASPRDADA